MTDNTTESTSSMMIDTSHLPSIKDIKKERRLNERKKSNSNNNNKGRSNDSRRGKGVSKRSNPTQEKKKADRNVVNLIQTDKDKEMMKKRAERFGTGLASTNPIPGLDDDAKKAARAERFGIMDDDAKKAARAERFGIITDADRMKARAERFGMK